MVARTLIGAGSAPSIAWEISKESILTSRSVKFGYVTMYLVSIQLRFSIQSVDCVINSNILNKIDAVSCVDRQLVQDIELYVRILPISASTGDDQRCYLKRVFCIPTVALSAPRYDSCTRMMV